MVGVELVKDHCEVVYLCLREAFALRQEPHELIEVVEAQLAGLVLRSGPSMRLEVVEKPIL